MNNLGQRIRALRQQLTLNQTELGDLIGVSSQTVSQWESGAIKKLDGANLLALAKALRTSPYYILDGQDARSDTQSDALTVAVDRLNPLQRNILAEFIASMVAPGSIKVKPLKALDPLLQAEESSPSSIVTNKTTD